MPITIEPISPLTVVGPGLPLSLNSDFIGPLPVDAYWEITVYEPTEIPIGYVWLLRYDAFQSTIATINLGTRDARLLETFGSSMGLQAGSTAHVQVTLNQQSGTLDTGTNNITWDPTSALWSYLPQELGGQQGLTEQQQQQLETAAQQSTQINQQWQEYEQVTLPSLQDVLNNITAGMTATFQAAGQTFGATLGQLFSGTNKGELGVFNPTDGPTCETIDFDIGGAAYFGLTVEVTSYPESWAFTTPAGDWSIRDLAVLRIERGGSQTARYGIHTLSFSLEELPDMLPVSLAGVGVPVAPPNYHIIVDWAGGVCGQLLLYYTP